jgi:Fe(3+) dicitrate transport protein
MTTHFKTQKSLLAIVIAAHCTFSNVASAEQTTTDMADADQEKSSYDERIQIIGHQNKLRTEAGSATLISEVELEKFNFDDINRVLYNVPGINIREEDGFGLRPNIGFRGATPERSKKITIMEDGILIGPAPYSAPSAYYFPMIGKMTSVEVFKGPAAIKYGPNTVAGALNMTTRAVPAASEGAFDLAIGSNGYRKTKGYYGNTQGNFGFLIEGIHLESDGFKELDGGGDTGFDKNDIMAKFRYNLSSDGVEQVFELKLGYADENSNETYLGLTDEDFEASPYRRYVASELDNMDWQHNQLQFSHFLQTDDFDLTTRIYNNQFKRDWFKINGFKSGLITRDLQAILANPQDETNALFYQVLTGQRDTENEGEKIIVGNNAREYYSRGIQSELRFEQKLLGLDHQFNLGFRYHQDEIERNHTEDAFLMVSANLESDGSAQVAGLTNVENTDALSLFVQDTISWQQLDVTLGLRGEFFDSQYQNRAPGEEDNFLKKSSRIWLPSMSVFYNLSEEAGLLFGIHEGFVPTSPQQNPDVNIENSINYELGGRYNDGNSKLEAIVFYNDISNLKEACSFSSCGQDSNTEFNGGEVDIYGLEFSASRTFEINSDFEIPISLVYTYSASEFKTSFESEFPMWGDITAGDEVPYLAENQATFNIGLVANHWDINLIARYIGEMLEASEQFDPLKEGQPTLAGVVTKAHTVVDFSAHYDLDSLGRLYLKIDNLFDVKEIVSRRPYGARPSKPQQLFLGYQYSF